MQELRHELGEVAIKLPYWTSQADYLTYSTDSRSGVATDWRMANANSRALAVILEDYGIEVEWVAGEDAPTANMLDIE